MYCLLIMKFNCIFSDSTEICLQKLALSRLPAAFAQNTVKRYEAQYKIFLAFCAFMHWSFVELSSVQILVFLEFLFTNNMSPSNVANYLTAIKTQTVICGLSGSVIDPLVPLSSIAFAFNIVVDLIATVE